MKQVEAQRIKDRRRRKGNANARPSARAKCDIAMPAARELASTSRMRRSSSSAERLQGARSRGRQYADHDQATEYVMANDVFFAPGKAANAGSVATSGSR